VNPSHALLMPKLVSRSGPVLMTARGAHHYRFIGVEISPGAGVYLRNLVLLGNLDRGADEVAHHFSFERSYLHGDPVAGTRRGIALNGSNIAVVDSHLADFKDAGFDSQALCGWNGPGPFKIVNNYLEAAGENVMFGGGSPTIQGLVPSDIEIRGNHVTKPPAWRSQRWTVKNLLELKNASRVLIDGNLFEHSWAAAQRGFAIVLTPRGENGRAPWTTVADITFQNNVVRHAEAGFNILGSDTDGPSTGSSRIVIRNNLVDGITYRLFQILRGVSDLVIEHNTALLTGAIVMAEGAPNSNFVFRHNLLAFGQYGIIGTGTASGFPTLTQYFPGARVEHNVFFGDGAAAHSNFYPPTNVFVPLPAVGFVAPRSSNWRLRSDSRFYKGATEPHDVGVDFHELSSRHPIRPSSPAVPEPRPERR
jgi:hypothetical protein